MSRAGKCAADDATKWHRGCSRRNWPRSSLWAAASRGHPHLLRASFACAWSFAGAYLASSIARLLLGLRLLPFLQLGLRSASRLTRALPCRSRAFESARPFLDGIAARHVFVQRCPGRSARWAAAQSTAQLARPASPGRISGQALSHPAHPQLPGGEVPGGREQRETGPRSSPEAARRSGPASGPSLFL